MLGKELTEYLGKTVTIFLKNEYTYTCQISKVEEESVLIIDKYNRRIRIDVSQIAIIIEGNKKE